MNRKMQAILQERQAALAAQHAPGARRHTTDGHDQLSPRERRDHRPMTAGTRPKVTCAMLNETERMLLKAPHRHKSMLSAGARPSAPPIFSASLARMLFFLGSDVWLSSCRWPQG